MRTVRTVPNFLEWAERTIRTAKPQKKIPYGFVIAFEQLFGEFGISGHLVLDELWGEYFSDIFHDVRERYPKTRKCNPRILDFVGQVFGSAMNDGGQANFVHLIEAITTSLGLETEDLEVRRATGKRRKLSSSKAFEERFEVRVRIPLSDGLAMRDGQLTYEP